MKVCLLLLLLVLAISACSLPGTPSPVNQGTPTTTSGTTPVTTRTPQVLVNTAVERKIPLDQLPDVQRAIAAIEAKLGDDGRVLVRYSGTESKARVMIEGLDESQIKGWADELAGMLATACRS